MPGNSEVTSQGLGIKVRGHTQEESGVATKQTFSHQCYKFASEATVHGVNRFGNRESLWFRRLLWLLLWLVMLVGLLTVVIKGALKYLSYPYNVNVEYENIFNHTFPDVTICNNNALLKSVLQQDPMAKMYFDSLAMAVPEEQYTPEFFHWLNTTDLITLYYKGAVPANELVFNCQHELAMGFTQCPNMTQIFTNLGVCYTLSGFVTKEGQPVTSSIPGFQFGFKFNIDIHSYEYSELLTSDGVGAMMMIHPTGVPPNLNTAFAVAPGTEQYVALTVTQTSRLGLPYSEECNSEKGYSQEKCRQDCTVEHSLKNCGCDLIGTMPSVPNCTTAQSSTCWKPAYTAVYLQGGDGSCSCPLPCEETTFNVELSSMKYPSDAAVEKITALTGHSKEFLERNIVTVNLFFRSFIAQMVQQEPSYGLAEFAADVGGLFGLFLGASIISIAELFEFLLDLFLVLAKRQMIQPVDIQS